MALQRNWFTSPGISWRQIQQLAAFMFMLGKITGEDGDSARDFCRWESFNATCSPDAVILIRSAFYGRMRLSRCTELDYYIGCFKDVLPWVDDRCSGRRQCLIAVPDPDLHEMQPCPKDLQTFLELDYECIAVQTNEGGCHEPIQVSLGPGEGYLSSLISDTTSFGTASCPWLIHVPGGQRINVTLFDFSVLRNDEPDESVCHIYAIIKERGQREETICAGRERNKRLYTSASNELQIAIVRQTNEKLRKAFLIKYEVIGCEDPPLLSESSWKERLGDSLKIGCNCSKETWQLFCKGTEWVGDYKDCRSCQESGKTETIYPYGLLFSVIIGVILGIFLGICLLAVLLTCKRSRAQRETLHCYVDRTELGKQAAYFTGTPVHGRESTGYSGFINPTHPTSLQGSLRSSSYAHIMDPRFHRHPGTVGTVSVDRDCCGATLRLMEPRMSSATGVEPGSPSCCGSSTSATTRTDLTQGGRIRDSDVLLDSGLQSKGGSMTSRSFSEGPLYNELPAFE